MVHVAGKQDVPVREQRQFPRVLLSIVQRVLKCITSALPIGIQSEKVMFTVQSTLLVSVLQSERLTPVGTFIVVAVDNDPKSNTNSTATKFFNLINISFRLHYPYFMTNSKNDAYQQKILQLLLRQQAAASVKQTVIRENTLLKEQINSVRREYQQKINQIKQIAENDLSRAQMEIRLAKMSKISESQKNQELENQKAEKDKIINDLSLKKQKIEDQLKKVRKDFDQCKAQLSKKSQLCTSFESKNQKNQQSLKQINSQNLLNQAKIEQLMRDKTNLGKLNSRLTAEATELRQVLEEANKKLQLLKNEDQMKTKAKLQKQQEFVVYQSKIQQFSRQNSILRERKKKIEEDIKILQQEKEQLQESLKKTEKIAKKNKEIISQQQSRISQLEQQSSINVEKYRNIDRNLKSAKREIQQLQQNLQTIEQSKNSQFSKYKKWEAITKTQKQSLMQKEQQVQALTQQVNGLKKQVETIQRSNFQTTIQLQKITKENKYLSQQYQQQQEKRIILQNQKDKSLSTIVKEKDILNKANFKLLQLLELKDKIVTSIIQAVDKHSDKIDITTVLQGQQLLKEIKQGDKQKLRNGKQRIKILEEWIKVRK